MGGQSEEVIEGFIMHNDQNGISASWKGQDPESKIADYMVAIGTTAGKTLDDNHSGVKIVSTAIKH